MKNKDEAKEVVISFFNYKNEKSNIYHTATNIEKLLGEGSSFSENVKNGTALVEYWGPISKSNATSLEKLDQFTTINLDYVCGILEAVWIDRDFGKNNPEYNNEKLVTLMGKIRPYGVMGKNLKELFESGKETNFTVRGHYRVTSTGDETGTAELLSVYGVNLLLGQTNKEFETEPKNNPCPHLNFEDLTLHGGKTTVEYMCTECKKWFSHREKTRIVMRRDIAEKNKVKVEDALDSIMSETQCKITEGMSISKTDLYRLHRESSLVYPNVYKNMSAFEKGLIEKIDQLDKRIQELEELLEIKNNG